jgi:nicotinamidase-related amidase
MKIDNPTPVHVVVDMLYDFIDGSLACLNANEAVINSVKFINDNPMRVAYVCDRHPDNHCSFSDKGGVWPPHCVAGTRGGTIHELYSTGVKDESSSPSDKNVFLKGENPSQEQYSGFEGIRIDGKTLFEFIGEAGKESSPEVYVSGIATEFCINETVKDLVKAGYKVVLITDALGYVSREGHLETLKKLEGNNVTLL